MSTLKSLKGRRAVVLVTGDPLWFSVGARIVNPKYTDHIPAHEVAFHPQLSAFQLSAARMGWSLADCETLTVHGRPAEQAVPFFAPGARLLVLTQDERTPAKLGDLLSERGFGPSRMAVLGALGGENETRLEGLAHQAADWAQDAPAFHTLAIECIAEEGARILPRTGLPDDTFEHDGKMTKQEVRAVTLAQLSPRRGALLWDVGLGCGSVAIEWMRAARDAEAIGIEPLAARRAMAAANALTLGVPRLKIIEGKAPTALQGLPTPDAVFIGGGLSEDTALACLEALKPHGRLVANAVTLESEALLLDLHQRLGGSLVKLSVARAIPVGPYRGWKPNMPVTQWVVSK